VHRNPINLDVRDDCGEVRLLGDSDQLVDRRMDPYGDVALVPDMAVVDPSVFRSDTREVQYFLGRGIIAGRGPQARGKAQRSTFHTPTYEVAHLLHLLGGGGAVLEAHHLAPDRVVGHELSEVDSCSVLFDELPLPGQIRRSRTVGIQHDRRDPLREECPGFRKFGIGQPGPGVGVSVDEARGDDEASGIDFASRGPLVEVSDLHDSPVPNPHVHLSARGPGSV